MERLRNMGLKRSFFLLSVLCLAVSLLLTAGIYFVCEKAAERYPRGGVSISYDGVMTELAQPSLEQERILSLLDRIQISVVLIFPVSGLGLAGILFYRLKLKSPITVLKTGTERIRMHDLDFSVPTASRDELGQVCEAFETMREELYKTNQELWKQAEERRRLNAAFAHDLRNPVTVLKGTVKQLRQGSVDEQALERLETYTLRIEQYVEAMSGIQRLEQMPVRRKSVGGAAIGKELEETAGVLVSFSRPSVKVSVLVQEMTETELDHGIFLTVAENLIGNAARFAQEEVRISLCKDGRSLVLSVRDDGPGFPEQMIQNGPKPFGKAEEDSTHFGMGLYSSQVLCVKHGGMLKVENATEPEHGGIVTAVFGY